MKAIVLALLTGHGIVPPLAAFVLAGLLIFMIAATLTRHADAIADSSGLGRVWIGVLLLAGSTSLPEIMTDSTAAAMNLPNLGIGDLFGSTLANMSILAVLVLIYQRRQLLQQAALDHALVGALAIVLTALAGVFIATGGLGVNVLGMGLDTLIIIATYLLGMRVVYDLNPQSSPETKTHQSIASPQLRHHLLHFGLATLGLLCVAPLLVFSAEALALETGIADSVIGTLLVGLTTSFPEMAAAVMAIRIGQINLAVGNLYGSNAFNMTVLWFMDIADGRNALLSQADHNHVLTSALAVTAMSFGVIAILARTHKQAWVARSIALMVLATYGLSVYLLAIK